MGHGEDEGDGETCTERSRSMGRWGDGEQGR